MSFILDALKKSEENRTGELAPQPGRHVLSPQMPARNRWALLAICILVPAISLFLGWWMGSKPVENISQNIEQSGQQQKPAQMKQNTVVPGAEASSAIADKTTEVKDTTPPPGNSQSAPAQTLFAPVPKKLQEDETTDVAALEPAISSETLSPTIAQQKTLVNFDKLPRSVRQEIPALNISLHFYSPDPARRMVRINGQIFHEHESVADNLVIKEIKESSTLFNFRGQIFELSAPGTK